MSKAVGLVKTSLEPPRHELNEVDWKAALSRDKKRLEAHYQHAVLDHYSGSAMTNDFQGDTTLRGIDRHRLRELILRDLEIYRKASISQIHGRIGKEIPRRKLQHELKLLVREGEIVQQGMRRYTVYLWTKKV